MTETILIKSKDPVCVLPLFYFVFLRASQVADISPVLEETEVT